MTIFLWNGPTWARELDARWNGPTAARVADGMEPKAARTWRRLLEAGYATIVSGQYSPPASPAAPIVYTADASAVQPLRRYDADVRGAMASGELAAHLQMVAAGGVVVLQSGAAPICRLQPPTPAMQRVDRIRVQNEVDTFDQSREDESAILVQEGSPLAPFAYLLGVNAQTRPRTTEMLSAAVAVLGLYIFRMKDALNVSRPHTGAERVLPMLQVPSHLSFPGGHAAKAALAATLLAPLVGGTKAATFLVPTAAYIGDNRVRAGLHCPLDTHAGSALGESLGRWLIAAGSLRASAPPWQGTELVITGSKMQRNELALQATTPDTPVWRGLMADASAEW